MKGKRRMGFYQLRVEERKLKIVWMFLTPTYRQKGIDTKYITV